MAKTEQLGFRLTSEVKAALFRAADHEDRLPTQLLEKILIDWLREHGFWEGSVRSGSIPRTHKTRTVKP